VIFLCGTDCWIFGSLDGEKCRDLQREFRGGREFVPGQQNAKKSDSKGCRREFKPKKLLGLLSIAGKHTQVLYVAPNRFQLFWCRKCRKKNYCGVKDRVVWRFSIKLWNNLLRSLCGTEVCVVSIATPYTHMRTCFWSPESCQTAPSQKDRFLQGADPVIWKDFFLGFFFHALFL